MTAYKFATDSESGRLTAASFDEARGILKIVSTDDFRVQLLAGEYVAETPAVVFLSHGKGDSRRDVAYTEYKAGETIVIPDTHNGFWYGLEPNGDFFSPSEAVLHLK